MFVRRILCDAEYHLEASLLVEWSRARWPGNVRELRNAVERQLLSPTTAFLDEMASGAELDTDLMFREAKELALRKWAQVSLADVLKAHDGKPTAAAESIGIDRNHLRRLMKRYGVA